MEPESSNKKLAEANARIEGQDEEIESLRLQVDAAYFDVPMLKISDDILLVPLIGSIDSIKSQKILEDVLEYIRANETRVTLLDITGVNMVDSSVAGHLVKIILAAKLMGCRTLICGVSPLVAQNIVRLGVDTTTIDTSNSLRDAIATAYAHTGLKLVSV